MAKTLLTLVALSTCLFAVTGREIPSLAVPNTASMMPSTQQQMTTTPASNGLTASRLKTPAPFCDGRPPGSYCQNCMMPVTCDDEGETIEYGPCPVGEACTTNQDTSYCAPHIETACVCPQVGSQCDAHNSSYVDQCGPSGPLLVELCASDYSCYQGECQEIAKCIPGEWNLYKPKCTSSLYCDDDGILTEINCPDGYYVNSDLTCSVAPPPECDGTCNGRCPNPEDCSKYFICQGSTVLAGGNCPADTFFDTVTNECRYTDYTCADTIGCDFSLSSTTTTTTTIGSTTTTAPTTTTTAPTTPTTAPATTTTAPTRTTTAPTTTTTAPTTTTTAPTTPTTAPTTTTTAPTTTTTTTTVLSPPICDEDHENQKYPIDFCTQWYLTCIDIGNGDYQLVQGKCLGDQYLNTDIDFAYCLDMDDVATC